MSADKGLPTHAPIDRERGVIDCACGYRQVGYYSEDFGARTGYMEHVVYAIGQDAGWPETFIVDGDQTYVGDAT